MSLPGNAERDNTQELYPQWIPNLFLTLTVFLVLASAILGISVYKLATRSPSLEDLSTTDRKRLVQMASQIVPFAYEPFPLSGRLLFYHMTPNTHYSSLLGDTFNSNELGFRSIPATPKPRGVKRIVLVGDSWTYGQGVHYEETFAHQLQKMLNQKSEAWQVHNLSMPDWEHG